MLPAEGASIAQGCCGILVGHRDHRPLIDDRKGGMTKAQARRDAATAARLAFFGEANEAEQEAAPPVQGKGASSQVRRPKVARQGSVPGASDGRSVPITPAEPAPANTLEHLLPRKWKDAPPQEGDLVFWRGMRFWIEPPTPLAFADSVWFRIGDHRVPKPVIDETTGIRAHRPLNDNRMSFYVHVDELSAVPAEVRSVGLASKLPTPASIARGERARAGVRDVGDDIAALLRSCDTLDKMYVAAGEYLGVVPSELRAKYGHLNNGQQRMNLGNRMRAKWRKTHG